MKLKILEIGSVHKCHGMKQYSDLGAEDPFIFIPALDGDECPVSRSKHFNFKKIRQSACFNSNSTSAKFGMDSNTVEI